MPVAVRSRRFSVETRRNAENPPINGEQDIIQQSKLIAAAWRALTPEEQKVCPISFVVACG